MAKKSGEEINSILVENFVSLQKAMTNLAGKFESLSEQISKLLQLFELSARSFSDKLGNLADAEKDREFLDKLNKLLDQNKLIAKGITLMEEKVRERAGSQQMQQQPQSQQFQYPKFSQPGSGYLPSINKEKQPEE